MIRSSTFKIASRRAGAALSTQSTATLFGSQQQKFPRSSFHAATAAFSTAPIDSNANEKPVLFDVAFQSSLTCCMHCTSTVLRPFEDLLYL